MQLKDLDKNLYFYILSFLTIQELGRLAQTNKCNRNLSYHDNVWRPIFIRDYHTLTFYDEYRFTKIRSHFKQNYHDKLPLLPLIQAQHLSELARQMMLLSHLFPKPKIVHKTQVSRVWYGSSDFGESITRTHCVRNTYLRIKSDCRSERESDQRKAKKARSVLNTSKEHTPTLECEDNDLLRAIYKK